MTLRWTAVDIARELGLSSPAVARSSLRRWRLAGIHFNIEIDPLTGTKRYLPEQIRAAHAANPGRGRRTDLRKPAKG